MGSADKISCKPPQGPQLEFVKAALRRQEGIAITHFVGGRRGGKTKGGMLVLAKSAFEINAGRPHLWTEPTNDDCRKIFLRTWRETIPDSLYTVKLNPMTITTTNGSVIDVVSREIKNSNAEPGRGTEYAFINFDELAKDPQPKGWMHMFPTLSDPKANQLICTSTSTPRLGWYKEMVCSGRGEVIYGSSYDNPYLDKNAIDMWKAEYSAKLLEQEIYAKWIALSDLAWEEADLEHRHPDGNLHPHVWDPSMPYVLALDIGVQSGAMLVQTIPLYDDFGWPTGQTVDVAVAEFTANNGNTEKLALEIDDLYGEPAKVIVGNDLTTRDVNTGITAAMVLQRSVGWKCPIAPVTGIYANKDTQHATGCKVLLNGLGYRQFCVSAGLIKHHKQSPERGIEAVLAQDTWADKPRSGEFLPKDKRDKGGSALEDMRDAFMYWAVMTHPPRSYKQVGSMKKRSN